MSGPPPTLLTLPTEVRLEILHYALCDPSLAPTHPNTILVSALPEYNDPKEREGFENPKLFYGTTEMSSLFVLCRRIHTELEEILFTRFIFSFPLYSRLKNVQFPKIISPQACDILREIMVAVHLDFGVLVTEELTESHNWARMAHAQNTLRYLKLQFPGLRKIHLNVEFLKGKIRDGLEDAVVKKKVKIFADQLMELVVGFVSGVEVVVFNKKSGNDVMWVFNQKARRFVKKSKRTGLHYDIKVFENGNKPLI